MFRIKETVELATALEHRSELVADQRTHTHSGQQVSCTQAFHTAQTDFILLDFHSNLQELGGREGEASQGVSWAS